MSKPLKPKRGTTAENDAYIGEAHEVTLDIEKHTLRVHDGVTAGGHELARGGDVGNIRQDTVDAAEAAVQHSSGESGSLTLEGVAAEVERKAATDLSNLSEAGRSLAAGLGMPSDRYVDLTLGASMSTYTAPANGYFYLLTAGPNAVNYPWVRMENINQKKNEIAMGYANIAMTLFTTVHKGDVVQVEYGNQATDVVGFFRFYYAEGEEG